MKIYRTTILALFKSLKASFLFALLFAIFCETALANDANNALINLGALGQEGSFTSKILQLMALVSVLSLAPAILVMVTSFTRISVVLSFLRSALGLQQSPPNQVMISLALFLTLFIMTPTMQEAYENGLKPMLDEKITEEVAIPKIIEPFKRFMLANTRAKDIELFTAIAKIKVENISETPLHVVIPSFMISELRRAFEIGFLIFLPFLIIDVLVASVLMAMGMMMMPPVTVSLPFKIIFFVIIDGWYMISGSLVRSFVT